jgi:NAD(P)-dependent dehydrogenase (short-subunit alcohol dehydrogenase family)
MSTAALRTPALRLDGDHALVTGAGRGIGRAAALALAEAGADVTLVARSADELEQVAADVREMGRRARVAVADVTDDDALAGVFREAHDEGMSILVTAAGTNCTGPTVDYDLADLDLLLALNVRALFACCRAAGAGWLQAGRSGRIVNLSSQMGSVGYPGRAAYCATKHAVDGITRALAVEWAPHAITVNALAPTFVETAMTASAMADPAFSEEVRRRLPGGEIAQLEDMMGAIVYLASPAARMVTGHILAVDGGWTAW